MASALVTDRSPHSHVQTTSGVIREWGLMVAHDVLPFLLETLFVLGVKPDTFPAPTRCLLAPSCEAAVPTGGYDDTARHVSTRDANYVVVLSLSFYKTETPVHLTLPSWSGDARGWVTSATKGLKWDHSIPL